MYVCDRQGISLKDYHNEKGMKTRVNCGNHRNNRSGWASGHNVIIIINKILLNKEDIKSTVEHGFEYYF